MDQPRFGCDAAILLSRDLRHDEDYSVRLIYILQLALQTVVFLGSAQAAA